MKTVGIVLLLLAGAAFVGAINVIRNTVAPSEGTYIGALAIPGLLLWWGVIALRKAGKTDAGKQ